MFTLLKPGAPFRPKWVTGSLSMTQLTSNPGHLWHEIWRQIEHKQKLLRSKSGRLHSRNSRRLVASAESMKFPTRGPSDTSRSSHICAPSSRCLLHQPCHRCNPSLHPIWKIRGNLNPKMLSSPSNTEVADEGITCWMVHLCPCFGSHTQISENSTCLGCLAE